MHRADAVGRGIGELPSELELCPDWTGSRILQNSVLLDQVAGFSRIRIFSIQ